MPLRRRETSRTDNPRAQGPSRPAPRAPQHSPVVEQTTSGVVHDPVDRPVGAATEPRFVSPERPRDEQEAQGPQLPPPDPTTTTAPIPEIHVRRYTADDVLAMLQGTPNRIPIRRIEEYDPSSGELRSQSFEFDESLLQSSHEEEISDSTEYKDPPPSEDPPARGHKRDLSSGELPPAQRVDLKTTPPSPIHAGPMRTSTPIERACPEPTTIAPPLPSTLPTKRDPMADPRIKAAVLRWQHQQQSQPRTSAPQPQLQPQPPTSHTYGEIAASPVRAAAERPTTPTVVVLPPRRRGRREYHQSRWMSCRTGRAILRP